MDHKSAIDILETVRSANGFTVAIILKPFIFEGQKRQDEVVAIIVVIQLRSLGNLLFGYDV